MLYKKSCKLPFFKGFFFDEYLGFFGVCFKRYYTWWVLYMKDKKHHCLTLALKLLIMKLI